MSDDVSALKEGISLYKRGSYSSALAFFLSLPDDADADPVDIAYYLGLCYAKMKRYDDAMLYLEQVVTAKAEQSEERVLQCRYLLAVIYCLSGRRKLADFELKKLLETGYSQAEVYSSLAYISWENSDVDKSVEYYERALKVNAECPSALNGLGYVLASSGRELTRALGLCKKAVDIQGNSAACIDSLGYVYLRMGLFNEARKHFLKALEIDSGNKIIEGHLMEAEKGE
ncbi:MAG: tetratricopeptide repeat protein [Treponema sp.]|nr:tetratricopeptide repeat protein [Treponema sp.]